MVVLDGHGVAERGENPFAVACVADAGWSLATDAGAAWLGGQKYTGAQALRSAGVGCASGMLLGPVGGAVLRVASTIVGRAVANRALALAASAP